jgi:hypothetical protein
MIGRRDSRTSVWRSGETSVPSRAFSGAKTTMSASIPSQNARSTGGSSPKSSSEASAAQAGSPRSIDSVSGILGSAYASRLAMSRTTSSSRGRAR